MSINSLVKINEKLLVFLLCFTLFLNALQLELQDESSLQESRYLNM